MLTGLIFATDDADDRPDQLAATLRLGGGTLLEYQASLLLARGAGQIIVAVARVTPELLAAVSRIGRRGVPVDVVRSASEATAKLHPLARIVVLADGLVTTDAILSPFTDDGPDALLVTGDVDALPGFERVDAGTCWAGIARLQADRLSETRTLPRDYDFQSSLLRVAAQAGARRIPLGEGGARTGHGIQRDSRALAAQGKMVFAAAAADRVPWFDRYVLAPIARLALPPLASKGVSDVALLGGGIGFGAMGMAALIADWPVVGLLLAFLAIVSLSLGGVLGQLQGEEQRVRWHEVGIAVLSVLSVLLIGYGQDDMRGTATGMVLSLATIAAGVLLERATKSRARRRWWVSPSVYPLLLLPFAAAGQLLVGLGVAAVYATASLSAAIEALRKQP